MKGDPHWFHCAPFDYYLVVRANGWNTPWLSSKRHSLLTNAASR
jgi:hypothetical protein